MRHKTNNNKKHTTREVKQKYRPSVQESRYFLVLKIYKDK